MLSFLVSHSTRRYSGIIDCFVLIWRHEGLGGLYKGLAPALVKAAPNTAITFLVYDGLVSAINRRRRRSADEE